MSIHYDGSDLFSPKAKKFKVTVYRTTYAAMDIEVEADDELQAHEKAVEKAANTVWSQGNAEYEVDYIEEIEEDDVMPTSELKHKIQQIVDETGKPFISTKNTLTTREQMACAITEAVKTFLKDVHHQPFTVKVANRVCDVLMCDECGAIMDMLHDRLCPSCGGTNFETVHKEDATSIVVSFHDKNGAEISIEDILEGTGHA